MNELTRLIKEDMKPALGVTEPGAIAFAVATARKHAKGELCHVSLRLNSGMFKNAFTCGIPGSRQVGNYHAAALGAVGADPEKGLECLDGITKEEAAKAERLVELGMISVSMSEITSRIFIEAAVTAKESGAAREAGAGEAGTGAGTSADASGAAESGVTHQAVVTIRDSHTNIVKITEDGKTVFEKETALEKAEEGAAPIHRYTLDQLFSYASTVPLEEIEFIREAYRVNWELLMEGIQSPQTTFAPYLLAANGGKLVSEDEQKTASLFCNGAIEARVIGLSKPAMSITGSGAHGVIATMPLYAACKVNGYSEEALLRATALSYLICMYIKEYSGRLSAFCGCAIAAGTGMACGLAWLKGGTVPVMEMVINNMASSITGMICDGGNQGCTMKGIVAVDAAFASVNLAMKGVHIFKVHGINGATPEETMRNMGRIASPGMVETERTIVEIMEEK